MNIRNMTFDDISFAVECTRAEGWLGQTEDVFEGFLQYDSQGCFIAEKDGQRIGMCVGVGYKQSGFIGELIVADNCRGQGIGTELLKICIDCLTGRGCRSVYLDGDTLAVPLYERLGFVHLTKSLRFAGDIKSQSHSHVTPMQDDDIEAVCALDQTAFGDDRSFFLRRRLEQFPELCHVVRNAGRVSGYIMGRPGHGPLQVGPWLVTESCADPIVLLQSLMHAVGGGKLRLGLLESNREASLLLSELPGLAQTEPSYRMVLGTNERVEKPDQLFAIGSSAKG